MSRRLELFRTSSGRLRVGWRLLLYVVLAAALYGILLLLAGGSFLAVSGALLASSLGAGGFLLALDGRTLGSLGFVLRRQAAGEATRGLLLGIVLALAAVVPMALLGAVRWSVEPGSGSAYLSTGLGALASLALPAAAEEALLRGYPLQASAEAWGPGVALVVTSCAFALLHVWNPEVRALGVVNVGVAGVFLGALYLRTGSLWWSSGAHLGWNWALGFLVDLPVSGVDVVDTPFLTAHARGPRPLSGGAFGPEGSVVATVVIAVAAAWVWNTRRLRPSASAEAFPPLAPPRTARGTTAQGTAER